MGELLRRYRQPVCTPDELRDLLRKEKLLCEEIVVLRDKKGRVGALDPHCATAAPRSNGAASRRRGCAAITVGFTIRKADRFEGASMQGTPTIGWEKTPLGVRYNLIKDLPNGNRMVRHAEYIVPNMFVIPTIREPGTKPKRSERSTELSWAVPIDNECVRGISIVAWPLENGAPKPDWEPGTETIADIGPSSYLKRSYEERQRKPDDLEAQEGQRPIAVHALENLAHSNTGIVMLPRLLREQLQCVEQGLDPINFMRDPSTNKRIPTGAWNTILSPTEAAALTYSEDL
jgi:hypothetical protein